MELLNQAGGWELLVKMIVGFAAAAAGIALWSHTREPAWILVVAATILSYVEVLLRFLEALGVFSLDSLTWNGIPWLRMLFAAVVPLLFTIGLVMALISIRRP